MPTAAATRSAAVLGFALGGFFDGILLHQILQWHHLLSLVPAVSDLRAQVLWDGWFHALMYLLAAVGLFGLWRAHGRMGLGSGRRLAGAALIGFGVWHAIDAVASHWLLGIHRIRVDSDVPLAWDLVWLVLFGIAPALAGWRLLRGAAAGAPRPSAAGLALLTLAVAGAGVWSLRPSPDAPFTTIVFAADRAPADVVAALAAADARLVWADPSMGVVIADMPSGNRLGLYAAGALLVGGPGLPAGCAGWFAPPAPASDGLSI